MDKNFNEANIKFISRPNIKNKFDKNSNKEHIMIQRSNSCKVAPAISAMKKSADYLID